MPWPKEPARHALAAKGIKTGRKKHPGAIGMKRAKSQGMWLWHSKEGGRLYIPADSRGYYFCATCDVEGRDPYVGSGGTSVSATWGNVSPGGEDQKPGLGPRASEAWSKSSEEDRLHFLVQISRGKVGLTQAISASMLPWEELPDEIKTIVRGGD